MTRVKIVIGANFGDEGKGLMTSYFAEQMMQESGRCLVVLSNGGAQRGHTVVRNGVRHIFRHFGSGTLSGADTWCPAPFILNPMIFMKEYRELKEQLGGAPKVRIFVHPDCRVTTPFEMLTNLILEESRGESRHGSVGVGIWETVIGGGISFGKLCGMSEPERAAYLSGDRKEHMKLRLKSCGLPEIPEEWQKIVEEPGLTDGYLEDLSQMESLVQLADISVLKGYSDIVFENGQGLLLDRSMIRKGFGHHTTPSNTGISNPAAILKEAALPEARIEAVYVTRSYMTRHGAGRFDTECPMEEINPAIQDLTNMPNPSQGTIRYGKLCMPSLIRRAKRDFERLEKETGLTGEFALAMTHLNEYTHPAWKNKYIKYKSFAEQGENMCYTKDAPGSPVCSLNRSEKYTY